EDVSVATGEPASDDGDKPIPGGADCPQCGARLQAVIPADEQNVTVTCPCGHRVTFYRAPNDPPDDWDKAPSEPRPDDRQPQTVPDPGPEPQQEGTIMQTEATGLASYAAAHQQFATELRAQMSGSESLAASMANILAEHSDLIGDTAILQDLLNQAAGVAERIAERSIAVANNRSKGEHDVASRNKPAGGKPEAPTVALTREQLAALVQPASAPTPAPSHGEVVLRAARRAAHHERGKLALATPMAWLVTLHTTAWAADTA